MWKRRLDFEIFPFRKRKKNAKCDFIFIRPMMISCGSVRGDILNFEDPGIQVQQKVPSAKITQPSEWWQLAMRDVLASCLLPIGFERPIIDWIINCVTSISWAMFSYQETAYFLGNFQ